MKKNSLSSHNSGTYTSPGTPDYRDCNVGAIQQGWCSERVPLPANNSRRHISTASLLPFNSGRTLPSKWDDAERWITSPVLGYGVSKTSLAQPQRRPKSKSGPLGAPGTVYYSNYSPAMPVLQGGGVRNLLVGSPLTTGVLIADGLTIHYGGGNGAQSNPVHTENNMARATSLPGWSDLLSESSSPSSQDEKLDGTKDSQTMVSRVVSRRDMATQMSPEGSTRSSSKERSPFSTSPPSNLPIVEPHSNHPVKLEVRDVQVDKRATVIRQSRKKRSPDVEHLSSSRDVVESAKNTKFQREEAKITAWENLQKAKAEAAIRKLEMKLEKKRSASMDKILNKLRIAQMKAQEMRSSISDSHACQAPRISYKLVSFRKYIKMGSLCGCFTCHAC
uniref:Remorin C-terminal domain-containing protein n=1 Tax=Davidia involucrata TaxID=16924 RepID=A0A5B6ZR65_DAVIN